MTAETIDTAASPRSYGLGALLPFIATKRTHFIITVVSGVLAQIATAQMRALDRFAHNAAETLARRGEVALSRLRYAEAALHFAAAAAAFPPKRGHEVGWNTLVRLPPDPQRKKERAA